MFNLWPLDAKSQCFIHFFFTLHHWKDLVSGYEWNLREYIYRISKSPLSSCAFKISFSTYDTCVTLVLKQIIRLQRNDIRWKIIIRPGHSYSWRWLHVGGRCFWRFPERSSKKECQPPLVKYFWKKPTVLHLCWRSIRVSLSELLAYSKQHMWIYLMT